MKGICFIEPMFIASVNKRKFHFRHIITPQPDNIRATNVIYSDAPDYILSEPHRHWTPEPSNYFLTSDNKYCKPKYKVGETVYLKEPYNDSASQYRILYKFNSDVKGETASFWKNKLFMPESAARYFIKITAVRVERLQDISDEDCIKEGIRSIMDITYMNRVDDVGYLSAEDAYAALIDKINGKGTWESNPFVWVYEFELVTK